MTDSTPPRDPARPGGQPDKPALDRERYELLRRLERWMETPMLVLAIVWLALLVIELIQRESPLFGVIGTVIWVVFIIHFAVEFLLAPYKLEYLKNNWLIAIESRPQVHGRRVGNGVNTNGIRRRK